MILKSVGHAQSVQHCVNICLSQGTQTVISQCLPNFESPSQTAMNDLKNDYKQCRRLIAYLRKKNDGLQLKISRLKDTLGKNDKETLVRQVTRIKDDAAKSIPGAVFLLEQLKHYGTKRTHWEKKMLQYCLIWRAKSEQGYSFIRNSQLLKLPDRATLRRHVENEGKKAGISTMYITVHDLPTLDRIVEQSTTVPPTELMFLDDQEDGIPIQLDSINAHSNFLTCS